MRVADQFEFEQQEQDGVWLARWIGDPELDGWKRDDLWGEGTPRFVSEYGMFQPAGLLYPALLGLVWRLTKDLARWALPEFDGVSMCERLTRPYELVRWGYGIDWRQPDWSSRDHGFVVAESHRARPASRPGEPPRSERFEGAALTPVSTWADAVSIIPVGDQANTLCLFATRPDAEAHELLLSGLRAGQAPRLGAMLATDNDVVAVMTQEDEGLGLSSLLIAGGARCRDSFREEVEQLHGRLASYLSATAAATSLEEWNAAVDHLADVT